MAGTHTIDVTTIARDGTVVLVVGTPPTTKLLVSTTALSDASEVFAALLGPNSRNGQKQRSPERPLEISLADDHADSMADMCRLLHGQCAPKLEGLVSVEKIYRLAVAVDKYACVQRLRLHGQALLLGYLEMHDRAGHTDLGRAAAAALLFQHSRAFSNATKRLVMETTGCFTDFFTKDFAHVIPPAVLLSLTVKRASAQSEITHNLPRIGMPECDRPDGSESELTDSEDMMEEDDVKCDNWDAVYVEKICNAFGVSYWPPDFRHHTISNAIQNIRDLGTVTRRARTCQHTGAIKEVELSEFLDVVRRLEKLCEGLCLGCVSEGVLDLSKPCRKRREHA
ncbi:hypothetical protein LTR56_007692 [Elasticomyces elasticus]|nr:hypothetical protein LTR56_007692 [Elasticomyces elasticus]KAK3661936.1 hypothetical protein LTR22_007310 [Elasticomyces elasticus]KAK4925551.1 hypothetical protein LTR49_007389 [Elasticomyces elasticus]KAK5759829.1 hypothetical protein LTS12_010016 [Elasticomyces elasticus]